MCETGFPNYRVSTFSPSFTSELKVKLLSSDTEDDFSFFSDSDSHYSFTSKVNIPVIRQPCSPRSTTPVMIVSNRKSAVYISNKIRSNVIDLEESNNFSRPNCSFDDYENDQHKSHCLRITVEEAINTLDNKPKNLLNYCHLNMKKVFDHTCNAPTISEKHLSIKKENIEFIQTEKVVSDNFLINGRLSLYNFHAENKPLFSSETSSECNFDYIEDDDEVKTDQQIGALGC